MKLTFSQLSSSLSKVFVTFSLALACSGCVVSMNLPISRLETPETHGGFLKGRLGVGAVGVANVDVVANTTATPPTNDGAAIADRHTIDLFLGVGLLERLDLDFDLAATTPGGGHSVPFLRLKYQWLGEPRAKRTAGGFAFATTLGAGGSSPTQRDTALSGAVTESKSKLWGVDVAAILGYRPASFVMFYGGAFFVRQGMDVAVTQPAGSATTYNFSTSANVTGANIGIQLDPAFLALKLEGSVARVSAGSLKSTESAVASYLGFQW